MSRLEKEIRELKLLLDKNEIDEIIFNKEKNRLIRRNDIIKKNKKKLFLNIIVFCIKLTVFIIICMFVIRIYKDNKLINFSDEVRIKEKEYVKSLNNIQEPNQVETTGKTTKIINGANVEIKYVAKYSIRGRVVDICEYNNNNNIESALSPKDVGISWGFLAKEINHEKLNWSSYGNRFLFWNCTDGEWIGQNGGVNKIGEYWSNNHLIPKDESVEELIDNIKENDFIKIEGYLVNVYCKQNNGSEFFWNSSTSRKDSGNGACEVIYVTNVMWLEEE